MTAIERIRAEMADRDPADPSPVHLTFSGAELAELLENSDTSAVVGIEREIRAALELEPQAWSYDINTTPFYNDPDGNSRGGNADGTYCLFGDDFEIDGEWYDGPILSERCKKADAKFIAACCPANIRALLAALDTLRRERDIAQQAMEGMRVDVQRLNWLDSMNAALNRRYGTDYRWRLALSPNVVRLMVGTGGNGHIADIDLHDTDARGFQSCRDAIDAIAKEQA